MSTPSTNNPGTSLPVAYAHAIDYFSAGIDSDGPFFRVIYWIANWADAFPLINILRGISVNTGGQGGTTTRSAPHQHPLSPNLFCVSAIAEGMGTQLLNAQGFPSYAGGARISAEYRPMVPYGYTLTPQEEQQQIDPATPILWCTQELDFTTEFFTISNSKVTWQTGPDAGQPVTGLAFRVRVPITVMSLTYHKVPYMPMGTIGSLQGKTNLNTFLGSAPNTVYFSGCKTTRDFNSDGTVVQRLQLTFMRRTGVDSANTPQLWNYLPSPTDLKWYSVAGTGGAGLYNQADFTPLLVF